MVQPIICDTDAGSDGVDVPVVTGATTVLTEGKPLWLTEHEDYLVNPNAPVSHADLLSSYLQFELKPEVTDITTSAILSSETN